MDRVLTPHQAACESLAAEQIVSLLESWRFRASSERALQDGIADLLSRAWPGAFAREQVLPNEDLPEHKPLGRRDRPDFWCAAFGIVVEVKLTTSAGTAPKVFDQLSRYAEHGAVRELVLATPSRRIASRIGDHTGGLSKPIARAVLVTGF